LSAGTFGGGGVGGMPTIFRVRVFGAIQAVQRVASWIRLRRSGAVEGGYEERRERIHGRWIGP
jgi:hypothetical protein